ncbi:MAG: organoarsenical effux MFS transporter ArsJ [Pseudomonadales bacterium]|nr:organoarsenical effux MFS transporter ArsJ [Pseudomonadales bacterium]
MSGVEGVRDYFLIVVSYWTFTLTDGALRMLILLYFYQIGFDPLDIAFLFIFYELFGVVTNLVGGWLAARLGLNTTLIVGLITQVIALSMLMVDGSVLTVAYVMLAQALSGIAKDLNKMSAKSGVKLSVPLGEEGRLYRWVSVLTGSKNALKGIGFFLGGLLLNTIGFKLSMGLMASVLALVAIGTLAFLKRDLGKTTYKPKFRDMLSKSSEINRLSAARFFLFGSRDVWFVIALPVFLQLEMGWTSLGVGTFLALWVIGYGLIQTLYPIVSRVFTLSEPDGRSVVLWGLALSVLPILILFLELGLKWDSEVVAVMGVLFFGIVFAVNSTIHSYLIVSYAKRDGVSLDVGFYYMSNAAGRLMGTVLSGLVYQQYGFMACIAVSAVFVVMSIVVSIGLPANKDRLTEI